MRDIVSGRRLIRYLHGELPAAEVQELRAELARDPSLQARLHELHRLWQGLKAAPPTPVPYGYVGKVQRLAEEQRSRGASSALGWAAAPPWARALAGAALLGGVAIGVGLGRLQAPAGAVTSAPPAAVRTVPAGIGAAVPASNGEAIVVSKSGAPVATEGASAAGQSNGSEIAASQERSAATTQEPPLDELLVDPDAAADGADASIGGSSTTLAEAYWQALAGDDTGGYDGELAEESTGLW